MNEGPTRGADPRPPRAIDIIIGGQFGSEGKGRFAAYLAATRAYDFAVRSGGPNAGHTFQHAGHTYTSRHIPCAVVCSKTRLLLSSSCLIDPDVLLEELEHFRPLGVDDRLEIDRLAGVISPKHIAATDLTRASTHAGVGPAQADRVRRRLGIASEEPRLATLARADVIDTVNGLIDAGKVGVIEGVQGSGLSLNNHWYPYASSRDVHASSMLSDAGLSPLVARDIYLVFRTYPIRWPGNSGPMGSPEITWDDVWARSGRGNGEPEMTSFNAAARRVSEFNWVEAERAVKINRPSMLCLSGLDYLDYRDRGVGRFDDLTETSRTFIEQLESRTNTPVSLMSTGPGEGHVIDRS